MLLKEIASKDNAVSLKFSLPHGAEVALSIDDGVAGSIQIMFHMQYCDVYESCINSFVKRENWEKVLEVVAKKICQLDDSEFRPGVKFPWTIERARRKDKFKKDIKEIMNDILDDFAE